MSGMILPGVYIEVRSEALIAPGQVTVGNLGVVGTASRGTIGQSILLSNYSDAVAIFGAYDAFMDPSNTTHRAANSLTLVRALELAFGAGATTVYAVRVADANAAAATATITSASGPNVTLSANSPGSWGGDLTVDVAKPLADDILTVPDVITLAADQAAVTNIRLSHPSIVSARNRVTVRRLDGTISVPTIVSATPTPGHAQFAGGNLSFGDALPKGAVISANFSVDPAAFMKITVALGTSKEVYLVTDGAALVSQIGDPLSGSSLVTATAAAHPTELPAAPQTHAFAGGANGATNPDYVIGLDPLLDVDAHIILAAGQSNTAAGAALDAHCQKASTDVFKRDRIAVVGSAFAKGTTQPLITTDAVTYVDTLVGNTLASDRVIFTAPGITVTSSAATDQPVNPVTLPGAYTAAVIAGMLAGMPPHISLTNKPVAVSGLEVSFNNAQLTELVQNRVTALEVNRGIRVLRGQTTDDAAFREITTRRIVDYAKYGVRAAASPYIGLLNNDRVRSALRATINSFLKQMLDAEMLVDYGLDVSATRDQQIAGIVQVTISLQPVFSINFIRVTMTLS